jgi:16S rRNA (guanine(527)-N(7))-methyltransferase RsmG
MKNRTKSPQKIWNEFKLSQELTDKQLQQFQKYTMFLIEQNKQFNLTALTDISAIIRQHFTDSISIKKHITLDNTTTIADIGSGAGFPSLPIKILYPHLELTLIEVNKKKQQFLTNLINILNLENVSICQLDWRTFLRKTTHNIDFFVTRAALKENELLRAFKSSCWYKHSTIIYWASCQWEPQKTTIPFIENIKEYRLGKKNRQLCFLTNKKEQVS